MQNLSQPAVPAKRLLSLSYLTIFDASAPEAVEIAAAAGFDSVGLRLLPSVPGGALFPIMEDDTVLRETLSRLNDLPVTVGDLEIVRLDPDTEIASLERFLERGAQLSARNVLVGGFDPDLSRLTDNLAAFAKLAAPYGLTADLEFMPWTPVRDADTALRIVESAAEPNIGILADALHYHRTGADQDALRRIPKARLNYAQICDAPGEYSTDPDDLLRVARGERLLPGEGGIDLGGFLSALPPDLPVAAEIPNLAIAAKVQPLERARHAHRSLTSLVGSGKRWM